MDKPMISIVSALRAVWRALGWAFVAYALTVICTVWLATVQPRNATALEEHAVHLAEVSLGESPAFQAAPAR